jgi:hypothetical protein
MKKQAGEPAFLFFNNSQPQGRGRVFGASFDDVRQWLSVFVVRFVVVRPVVEPPYVLLFYHPRF